MSESNDAAAEGGGHDGSAYDGGQPEVDTTLLESLFYNEMMMMDGDGSDFLTSLTASVGDSNANIPPPPIFQQGLGKKPTTSTGTLPGQAPAKGQSSEDPLTFAEQSLLRDFGVTDSPFPHLDDSVTATRHAPTGSNQPQPEHDIPQNNPPETKSPPPMPIQPHPPTHYPPQQQYYANHHYYHGHPYPPPPHPSGHLPPHHTYPSGSNQPAPIQPRPPSQARGVSKGIKHSVSPRETLSPQSVATSPPIVPNPSIPNPMVNQHQAQPPHVHTHHPPPPPPPYHAYPHHQPHPHHQGQHAYHYHHHHHPPPGASTPVLVPVPAPAPHQQSAYPPPPSHLGVHPSYAAPPPPHASPTTSAHPPAHVTYSHSHPPPHSHPHSHPPPVAAPAPAPPPPPAPAPPPVHPQTPGTRSHTVGTHSHSQPNKTPSQPPKEQLVSQFATLANRLGINLPKDLLSSLTKSAGMITGIGEVPNSESSIGSQSTTNHAPGPQVPFPKNTKKEGTYAPRQNSNGTKRTEETSLKPVETPSDSSSTATTTIPVVPRKTAEEAVAAVTRKRSHDESSGTPRAMSSTNSQSGDDNKSNCNKQSYAKRRKKPRLADCESRLAQLRAENETLKRHLDNVTNQTEKFEQDRIKAENMMKEMMENNDTPDEELDKVIREYSEAYSDYGRRRHEELSFHLEQLQKLANPTNFTKMGLWTIARANDSKDMSKQNPLVGILQKELGISPPQVRKILDQREKIRALCSNLNATLSLILQLKELCELKNKKFNDRLNKTREILTPKQVVKLIMWIKDYSDVLGNVCPGWTSEQIVKKKAPPQKGAADEKKETNEAVALTVVKGEADAGAKTPPSPAEENPSPVPVKEEELS